jgi:hypothetical protein
MEKNGKNGSLRSNKNYYFDLPIPKNAKKLGFLLTN